MEKRKFTAKVYELLNEGLIEVNGKLYYSEESVLNAMEWLHANLGQAVEIDAAKLLSSVLEKIAKPYT